MPDDTRAAMPARCALYASAVDTMRLHVRR